MMGRVRGTIVAVVGRVLRVGLLGVLMAGGAFAGPALAQPVQDEPGEAVRELRSLRVVGGDPQNAGDVEPGHTVTRRLRFQNVLRVPVEVEIVSRTCACVETRFEPSRVGPGEHGVLTLTTVAAPVQAAQIHSAAFRVRWTEDGEARSEVGHAGVEYRSAVDFTVFPQTLALAGLTGDILAVDVVIFTGDDDLGRPDLLDPRCSLEGWTVRRATNEHLPLDAARFTISGPVRRVGIVDGEVEWTTHSTRTPSLRVPIRLRGLSEWRAFPGGAWFVGEGQPAERTLRLIPRREGLSRPASVECSETPGLTARLIVPEGGEGDEPRVVIALAPDDGRGVAGAGEVRVRDARGRVLATIPVVWYPGATPAKRERAVPAR